MRRRRVRRLFRKLRRLPAGMQAGVAIAALLVTAAVLNAFYQVARKPAELFYPVSGALYKTPAETWRQYETIFREHATPVITPELLAALAQAEASGNPVATPQWRFRVSAQPLAIYRPASSAVGMYQITDGTFAEAKRLCIHDHAVAQEGRWDEPRSCWFNWLYLRVVPTHAAEMTSALLDRQVREILAREKNLNASLNQKQDLAALIHLCGAAAGEAYARRRFRLLAAQHCGEHDAAAYLARVGSMKLLFARLSAEGKR